MRMLIITAAGALLASGAAAQTTLDLLPMANYCLGADELMLQTWRADPAHAPAPYGQASLIVSIQRLLAFTADADPVASMTDAALGGADARRMLTGSPSESAAAWQRLLRCRDLLHEIP